MHKNIESGVQEKNGNSCPGIDELTFKYLGVTGGCLVAKRLDKWYNNEWLQATMKHVGGSLKVWVAFLQMELTIWSRAVTGDRLVAKGWTLS